MDRAACVLHVAGRQHHHRITTAGARPWIILKCSESFGSAKRYESERAKFSGSAPRRAGARGRGWLLPFACHGVPYCFGEVRVATLALLIFTALSGWRSCGVIITKFSDHVVTFRSSPTVFADTPLPRSASTRILAGKPPRAMSSAAMLLHLFRGIGSSPIALPPRRRAD
jgi:hypothetical protein